MTREQLEHVIRAAGRIAEVQDLVIVGSRSVLGLFPDPPPTLTVSMEADVYPRDHPERADGIDGAIGELSDFHQAYGYYAQGVGPRDTTPSPRWSPGWRPSPADPPSPSAGSPSRDHDLAMARLVAGRHKDGTFVRELAAHGMVDRARLEGLVPLTTEDPEWRSLLLARIARAFAS